MDLHAPNVDLLAILFVSKQLRCSIGWRSTLCVAVDWTIFTLNKLLITETKVYMWA